MPNTPPGLRTAALAASAAMLLAAAGCTDNGGDKDTDRAEDLASQKLDWQKCSAPSAAEGGGPAPSPLPGPIAWECSFMDVPLDYDKPDGDTIELALIRAKARNADQRIGSLIFNFGGPGDRKSVV